MYEGEGIKFLPWASNNMLPPLKMPFGHKSGKGGGYMREMGAICQIGVLTWKPCTFRVQNGFVFGLFALRFQSLWPKSWFS